MKKDKTKLYTAESKSSPEQIIAPQQIKLNPTIRSKKYE
jgi:hypothetical protein